MGSSVKKPHQKWSLAKNSKAVAKSVKMSAVEIRMLKTKKSVNIKMWFICAALIEKSGNKRKQLFKSGRMASGFLCKNYVTKNNLFIAYSWPTKVPQF